MLTFVDEMTSAPPPGHLTPLPCLLSCLNWLPHPRLILLTLSMLMCPHHPPDETPTLPSPLLMLSHPHPYHLYARGVPSSLCSHGALPTCLQHSLPSLRWRSAFRTWL
ncbi:hypothetical protein O181_092798 [Austropuccinia psidii MF-1]|uniref:Uncharacterized protein n=1 Tax=Austropuccinia psidii MF-1 TaxID=1389203 RepID=A0A9Q3P8S9_9BASI|nr:hypothetical protein [Austropuccinia psidii MF-1]